VQILRFLLREVYSSPLSFILPLKEDMPSITPVLRGRRE
jgi:hypothetical protein